MTRRIAAITLILMTSVANGNPLIGTWQSDEDRTLQEVRSIPNLPKKARDLFENNFFGKLKLTFTDKKMLSESDGLKSEEPYEVVKKTDDSITIKTWSELLNRYDEITYYIEGQSIYVFTSKYNFKEYFKRIK